MSLDLRPDPSSPVPLYHQIAEAIRYRIATGELAPGTVLPPLRDAAARWRANLHTVRRAYVELAREGLVETQVPRGTVVLPGAGPGTGSRGRATALDAFVDRVVAEARRTHRLTPDRLIERIERRHALVSGAPAGPVVHVVECSATQSADLAAQLMQRWRATAIPWPLGRAAPPGRGPVVATYFHYAEIRAAWPGRVADVHFLGIRPDPALTSRLEGRIGRVRGRVPVLFCEREDSMLHNIATDLARILPGERFRIVPRRITRRDARRSRFPGTGPVLLSPRVWGELSESLRRDPRLLEARYVFESKDLEALGSTLRWRPQ